MSQGWKSRPGKKYLVNWFKSVPLPPLAVRPVTSANGKVLAHVSPRYRIVKDGQEVPTPVIEVKRRSKPKPGYACGSSCI